MHGWKKLLIPLCRINIWRKTAHKNVILEIGYATTLILQTQCCQEVHFTNSFPKLTSKV